MVLWWVLCGLGCASGHLWGVILVVVAGSDGSCGSFRKAWGSMQVVWIASFWLGRLQGLLNEGAAGSGKLCAVAFSR